MTLFDVVKSSGGLDICDTDWDFGVYFDFSEDSTDAYDLCLMEIARRTEVVSISKTWYSPCKITEMIVNNIEAFKQLFNEENCEGYRPMDYENADDPTVDDGFFEAYMEGLENLIIGNYTDDDYRKLLNNLLKKGA